MPLVRIITRLAEYPTELVRDLQTRGFAVEVCPAPNAQQEAADLEITLDQCTEGSISKSVTGALAGKDVVIIADAQSPSQKIRSIGMVLLSPEASMAAAAKTALPAQLNEIYTALLRERAANTLPASGGSTVSESLWTKTVAFGKQRGNGAWIYGRAVTKNLGQVGGQVISESAIWFESQKLNWRARRASRLEKNEPDLVPSMFGLSRGEDDIPTPPATRLQIVKPVRESKWTAAPLLFLWKPFTAGSIAVVAIALLFHDVHSYRKAQAAAKNNSVTVQSQTTTPAIAQKPSKEIAVTAPIMAAKAKASEDDTFQEVVVRHFPQSSSSTELPKDKDKVKRRVVVD